METFFGGDLNPLLQVTMWIVVAAISLVLGPGCWKTYKEHVALLREEIDDLENSVARLRESRDKIRDDLIGLQAEVDYLKKLLNLDIVTTPLEQ